MSDAKRPLNLDRRATYRIKVPGRISESWVDWIEGLTMETEHDEAGQPVSILTGALDQAALQGLLRRLYALGTPLLSVVCVDCEENQTYASSSKVSF